MNYEDILTVLFMFLVIGFLALSFYKGYRSRDKIRRALAKAPAPYDDVTSDDTLINSDGRPEI